ncbi:Heat stress transcription factor A-6B [Entamoeba marina]
MDSIKHDSTDFEQDFFSQNDPKIIEKSFSNSDSIITFVAILYQMVDCKDNAKYITWSSKDNGHSFEILEPVAFSKEILPKYYKHTNFCGFTRQLTLYGFTKMEEYRFSHENFIQDKTDLLKNIKRKKPTSQRKKQGNTTVLYQQLLAQLMQLQKQNIETLTQINTLKELLYQLKLREDSLELKMQRLQDTFFPNSNPLACGFGGMSGMMNMHFGSSSMSQSNDPMQMNFQPSSTAPLMSNDQHQQGSNGEFLQWDM